jgi:hypothetical protein
MPGSPYEEFVEDRAEDRFSAYGTSFEESAGVGAPEQEEEKVAAAIGGRYEAIGRGDFDAAQLHRGPTYRGTIDEGRWIADEESHAITGSAMYSLEVSEVSESVATADVDVGFEDNTGSPAS